jgi:hypothetical protein
MKPLWTLAAVLAGLLVCPEFASAQCEAVPVVTDGRTYAVDSSVTPTYAWFYVVQGRSYSIEVTPPDGMTGVTPFAPVISDSVACPTTTSAAGIVNTTSSEPRVNQGARWSIIGTSPSIVALRMRAVGQRFKVSVSETTLFNPSWSTAGAFATQWGLQNTTGSTITGTLTVQESFGGSASHSRSVSLPANSTTFVTTFDQFSGSTIPSGRGGSATFAHVGPPGAVQGDAYLVSAIQTVPAVFKPVRETGR